ncbi:MAG TPA: cation transporter [Candidatus Limnocylindria bacterium]|nr:cation transporter [Candidatus Limnocylindria bacterium]
MRFVVTFVLLVLCGTAARAADVERRLALSGLTCAACSAAVTKALERVPGVHEVTVSADRTQAVVVADEAVAPERLVEAVTSLGYGARAEAK